MSKAIQVGNMFVYRPSRKIKDISVALVWLISWMLIILAAILIALRVLPGQQALR